MRTEPQHGRRSSRAPRRTATILVLTVGIWVATGAWDPLHAHAKPHLSSQAEFLFAAPAPSALFFGIAPCHVGRGAPAARASGAVKPATLSTGVTIAAAGRIRPVMVAAAQTRKGSLDEVMRLLMCTCGCNLTLAACEVSMTCEVAKRMRAEAEGFLSKGMSTQRVLDAFVSDYGERVRAAPTKSGFNLTAWVLPFAGLLFGALLLALALRRWRAAPQPVEPETQEPVDPDYLSSIEDEVKRGM